MDKWEEENLEFVEDVEIVDGEVIAEGAGPSRHKRIVDGRNELLGL